MAELADVLDLGSSVAGRVGSNPTIRTSMAIPKAQILPSILSELRGKSVMLGWSDYPSVHK